MRRGRVVSGICAAAVVSAAAAVVLIVPATARADITGPCTGSIAGTSVKGLGTSESDAITVDKNSVVNVGMAAQRRMSHYSIALAFAGFNWTVKDKDISSQSWDDGVSVDKYAKYGVGLYRVTGTSTGPGLSCSGAALVKVTGNPLSTAAGVAGLAMAVVGVGGVAAAGGAAAGQARRQRRSVEQWVTDQMDDGGAEAPAAGADPGADERTADNIAFGANLAGTPKWCGFLALSALMLTTGAMLGGAGGGTAPAGTRRLPRVRFAPRISFIGLLSGLLLGIGVGVLLQQYAVLYPTRTIAIVELACGLALGILIPSLMRLAAVRKTNRAIDRVEQRRRG
jgi:hypothetical protein